MRTFKSAQKSAIKSAFANSSAQKKHFKKHFWQFRSYMPLHGDSRIVQCDYASSDSSNLRKHMKRHKTGKIYLLPISIYHFCFSVIREVLEMLSHQSETQVARLGNE